MEWRCPHCQSPLTESAAGLDCSNRHHFDRARQGYIHLLPVNQQRSKNPGDNAEMVASRQAFLDQGYYQPIVTALEQQLQTPTSQPLCDIADIGCGDGFYTRQLAETLAANNGDSSQWAGIDISKPAIKTACQRNRTSTRQDRIDWAVASAAQLPLIDHSMDALLCLFAHIIPQEFTRVLRPGGKLLVASSGPDHLREIREQLYDHVKAEHFDPREKLAQHMECQHQESIRFRFTPANTTDLSNLLGMTPHFWKAKPERKQALLATPLFSIQADISLWVFQ